jgi:hypothetical protein
MRKTLYILLLLAVPAHLLYSQWTLLPSGTTNGLSNIFFVDQNTGTVVGASGTVRKTTNGGVNWSAQTVVAENLYNIFYVNSSTGYICGDGVPDSEDSDGWSFRSLSRGARLPDHAPTVA